MQRFEQELIARKEKGIYRILPPPPNGLIDFSSNDYLGLAKSRPLEGFSGGSTGSRLLTGNSAFIEALEGRIAQFHHYESATIFNCGYMANVGLFSCIASKEDIVIYDTHVHASIHDGIRLSGAQLVPFRHNDVDHLEKRLKTCSKGKNRFVAIESVYSIDGKVAPLQEISALCALYGAYLIVDEAHAVGIFEEEGRGLVAKYGLTAHVFAQVVTFGKALGAHGAAVLGKKILKEYLINCSRPFIYTTAPPVDTLTSISSAYERIKVMQSERAHLQRLQSYFHNGNSTPIQSVRANGALDAIRFSQFLAQHGYDVRSIRYPTVRRGHESLRISLHAYNSDEEVKGLLSVIQSYRGMYE